jgi:hypothetical protein
MVVLFLLKSARELNMADESAADLIIKGGKLAVERKVQQKSIYNILCKFTDNSFL